MKGGRGGPTANVMCAIDRAVIGRNLRETVGDERNSRGFRASDRCTKVRHYPHEVPSCEFQASRTRCVVIKGYKG